MFKPPSTPAATAADAPLPPWKILIVDDEPLVHLMTRMALSDLRFRHRGVEFHTAENLADAWATLRRVPDIAVALIDVVMETDSDGLALVERIRNELDDPAMRIILRTGQPGLTPERTALAEYDINTYLDKSTTDANRLYGAVLTALRSYSEVSRLRQTVRHLEALSATDQLTGLNNPSTLRSTLCKALSSAQRRGEPLSVVFLDLDDFKRVNDLHGHQRGNEILSAAGAAILANSRLEDGCFRYGGDEFFVILPNCTEDQVREHYLRRLLPALERIGIGVSHGVAQAGPEAYDDADTLIQRSDQNMYAVKRERQRRRQAGRPVAPVAAPAGPIA
ncbi:diguanylate cyclase [Aquincola sp. MAHUQ-54]|uniref:diguanylate cyclase n=1 Tax=Aquincola agrisoli TaxID=3119538 RepID=A0AAW9Q0F1_9BURK